MGKLLRKQKQKGRCCSQFVQLLLKETLVYAAAADRPSRIPVQDNSAGDLLEVTIKMQRLHLFLDFNYILV